MQHLVHVMKINPIIPFILPLNGARH